MLKFLLAFALIFVTSNTATPQPGTTSAQDLFEQGYSALQSNDLPKAEALFRDGLRRGGIDAKMQSLAHYYLAEALRLQRKSSQEAIQHYQQASRLNPGSKEAIDAAEKARAIAAAPPQLPPSQSGDRPTTLSFLWNGSWNGQVTAYDWGGINTTQAWAIGKASKDDLREICQASGDGGACVREMTARPPTEIFADCEQGVAWQKAFPDRWRLTELVAGKKPEGHRSQSTVASWYALLCPTVWAKQRPRG